MRTYRQTGYSLMNLSLTLLLAALVAAGILAFASMLDTRRKVNETLDLAHRAAARTKELGANQADGYATLTTAQLADLVPVNQRTLSGGNIDSLRTALNRPLRLVPNGNFAFWIRLSNLSSSECRALIRQAWLHYPRVQLNAVVRKTSSTATLVTADLDACAATNNTLDMEGS
ncbi:hypothetical protein C7S18_20295 [Ahniella affigens]|uniref:Type 4 fimbrial biogenesis protein PilX N-terminal domain-containing protein n=1 Tax=Ahniella affigens TaxID=2021234 RepID=A0A2P1PWZ2_9GAMM|nr:hypothetical protein [Ahniella affigens]AVP99368.1 hypothetical protein C7S18_20295 [Ahniella affigens]